MALLNNIKNFVCNQHMAHTFKIPLSPPIIKGFIYMAKPVTGPQIDGSVQDCSISSNADTAVLH